MTARGRKACRARSVECDPARQENVTPMAKNQEPRTKNNFTYPGGKNGQGVFHRLINQIPPHSVYVEPFVGSGAVLRRKLPAVQSYAIDIDPGAIAALTGAVPSNTELFSCCGIAWLESADFALQQDAFVYCDPPYLPGTRRKFPMYAHEMTASDHARLLDVLCGLSCRVMISGYASRLYCERLKGWRSFSFAAMTRGNVSRREWVWCNYPSPVALHDYRFLGENYRQRENFARQLRRWKNRLQSMPLLRRQALLAAIAESARAPAVSPVVATLGRDRRKRR